MQEKTPKLRPSLKIKKIKINLLSFLVGGLVGLFFLFFLGVFLIGIYHFAFWGKIYPGIRMGGVSLGGLARSEAESVFSSWLEGQDFNQLKLVFEGRVWFVDLQKTGHVYEIGSSVDKAYSYGRGAQFLTGIKEKYFALKKGVLVGAIYKIDEDKLQDQVASVGAQLMIPAVEPEVEILDKVPAEGESRVVIKSGENGQELNEEILIKTIKEKAAFFDEGQVELPVIEIKPKLTKEEMEEVKKRAEKLLDKNLLISSDEQRWQLEEKDLINFLGFKGGFEEEKIASFAAQLGETIDKKPQNATFTFDGVRVTEFRPGKDGLALDQEKTIKEIGEKLESLEKEEVKTEKIILAVGRTPPEIKTEEVNNLGIRELLGKGESYFRGSIAGRIHNIDLASSRINGVLIKPGEVFSLNQSLGEVSKKTGYQEAYIIREGKTILGDGGGVCQVSTTLFRAVLRAGLPVLERRAHAYRVSYYEQGFPPGQDATVWDPSPDFKFQNDTSSHLLIQRVFNKGGRYLSFEIYGTSDERKVMITNSKVWDQTPPPPDLYVDDPTLPTGAVKQIDWKAWGAKVSFGWKVVRDGEVLQDRVFYSSYRPWQAVFLKGTGG